MSKKITELGNAQPSASSATLVLPCVVDGKSHKITLQDLMQLMKEAEEE